jgi:hypothetical protein
MREFALDKWFACALIGDGVMGVVMPRRYLRDLEAGPKPLRRFLDQFARRPELTRAISISEVVLGAWILIR